LQEWKRDMDIYSLALEFNLSLLMGLKAEESFRLEQMLQEINLEYFIRFMHVVEVSVWQNDFYNQFRNRVQLNKYSRFGLGDEHLEHSYFYCDSQYISRIDQSLLNMVFNILLILYYLAELSASEYENLTSKKMADTFSKTQINNLVLVSCFNHNNEVERESLVKQISDKAEGKSPFKLDHPENTENSSNSKSLGKSNS
jgi:hypothetical protein